MLSELKMVGDWYAGEIESAWNFEEIRLDVKTQQELSALSQPNRQLLLSDFTAKVVLSGRSNNHCYVPAQYFLYALKLRPFLILLSKYQQVLSDVSAEAMEKKRGGTIAILQSRDESLDAIAKLDAYSRANFFTIFEQDNSQRLGAKAFIKNNEEHRGISDFFSSILLAAIPVPNASSSTLADLLLLLSSNQKLLIYLQMRYSHSIPWLYRCVEGDDIILRVMSTLGWEGRLDDLVDNEPVSWGHIADAFILRPIPEPSNSNYIDTPIHFLESCNKYVFVRKGLLSPSTLEKVSGLIGQFWPGMCVRLRENHYFVEAESRNIRAYPAVTGAVNKIFYGAPGTGKSHRVLNFESLETKRFITVFHPDTQHSDFVGSLKPFMDEDNNVSYRFRAGPFTNALVYSLLHPACKVSLIIEEINRAAAATVFGELFQLLDRDVDGKSAYEIDASDPDMLRHINAELEAEGLAQLDKLRIPSNLSMLATMNSSDQAVMPLDTAFRRRWQFEYLPIDFDIEGVPQSTIALAIGSGRFNVKWQDLAKSINSCLIECDVPEDRLIGPFFLGSNELDCEESRQAAIRGKLFIYLWDDVLRHHGHERIFASAYRTFGELSSAFCNMQPVFSAGLEERLLALLTPATDIIEPPDVAV